MARVRRCAHFVPGASEKMLNKALATEADALVLDLEEAVTPENKDSAREVAGPWPPDGDSRAHDDCPSSRRIHRRESGPGGVGSRGLRRHRRRRLLHGR